jgi:ribonucleoside-diphosphate reductase beta chain
VKIFKEVLAQYPEYNDQKLEYFVRHTFEEVDLGKSDFFEQKSTQYVKVNHVDNGFDKL